MFDFRLQRYDDSVKQTFLFSSTFLPVSSKLPQGTDENDKQRADFKDGDAEFQAFVDSIGKPVETVVMDYHEGKKTDIVSTLPEGMKQFMKGEVYSGMMAGSKQNWGDTMVELADTINGNEVKCGETVSLAGRFARCHRCRD